MDRDLLLQAFAKQIYGFQPHADWDSSWELLHEHATDSGMRRQQWALQISTARGATRIVVLVDLPRKLAGAEAQSFPAFLGLNFHGNHTLSDDAAIFDIHSQDPAVVGHLYYAGLREQIEVPVPRGHHQHRWPSELITASGYAAITACYLQLGPDSIELFNEGMYSLFSDAGMLDRPPHQWSGLGIWAWVCSRILDGITAGKLTEIDPKKVLAVGHSRLGKAALWAAACDERFAGVISNNSGCMGAALSRAVGETPALLAQVRPYWFTREFNEMMAEPARPLTVDQYQLLELIAPRLLYVASASDDAPADPEGEFISWMKAARAWGAISSSIEFPQLNTARTMGDLPLGYHLREGGHEMMPWDWEQWLRFADRWL